MDNMISIRFLEFLLFLLLHQVYSEEAESMFKAEGSTIEMGYCFGVDYILVYRSFPEGEQLLGNSSAEDTPSPTNLEGRIRINEQGQLLGLQISHLTHMDSGIYRRECWQNRTLVSQRMMQLFVCDEEAESGQIIVKEQNGRSMLLCNTTSVGLEGTSVRWYYELYPSYKLKLFLDSSVSLDPLVKELQELVEVRDSGALLFLDNSMLKNNQHFYCLVTKGKKCLGFQNIYLPDHTESKNVFASQGDRVVLHCPSDGNDQQWDTPLGKLNGSNVQTSQMSISFGDKSEDFSLIIPAVSDEHIGDYSCISSSLELQYSLFLCPKKEAREKVVFEGEAVLLECDVNESDFKSVQWHRLEPTGEYELIFDSNDGTVPVPQDLSGRLTVSQNGSSLTISHLEPKDPGVYWCVVSEVSHFLDDYVYEDYSDEATSENELSDDPHWNDRCLFKQETILSSVNRTISGVDSQPVTAEPDQTLNTTADPSAAFNVAVYVGAGVAGLLVAAVIVAVIVIKKRAKVSLKSREAASLSDIKMNVDPGCTESLTRNDEHGA